MPKPHGEETRGAAKEGALIPSIISAATIDGNQCHQEICESLIPHSTGWESLFLREMAKLPKIGVLQRGKIFAIAERYEKEKATRRICRHCQGIAQNIDEFSYFCRNCGNCLNLDWNGGAK